MASCLAVYRLAGQCRLGAGKQTTSAPHELATVRAPDGGRWSADPLGAAQQGRIRAVPPDVDDPNGVML
jgi:hypothetical protein